MLAITCLFLNLPFYIISYPVDRYTVADNLYAVIKKIAVLPIGTIEIPVLRQGSDLSSMASVWCATRPADQDSATPGVDYIPSSKKVHFKPGKTEEVLQQICKELFYTIFALIENQKKHLRFLQTCSLTIMDDIQNPTIEGKESFIVFLSSPNGAVLTEPHEAIVSIVDSTQDRT